MNSREKAEEFMSDRCGGTDFYGDDIEELTRLLDAHADEAITNYLHYTVFGKEVTVSVSGAGVISVKSSDILKTDNARKQIDDAK